MVSENQISSRYVHRFSEERPIQQNTTITLRTVIEGLFLSITLSGLQRNEFEQQRPKWIITWAKCCPRSNESI